MTLAVAMELSLLTKWLSGHHRTRVPAAHRREGEQRKGARATEASAHRH